MKVFLLYYKRGRGKKKSSSAPLGTKDTSFNFPYKFELVCYLEYFTISFIASEAELDLGLTLGSRCFLGGDHIYSPEIGAWLLPLCAWQLNPALSDVCSWKRFGAFHSSLKGRGLFLQSAWHEFCLRQDSSTSVRWQCPFF